MERATGLGGVFLPARDVSARDPAAGYAAHPGAAPGAADRDALLAQPRAAGIAAETRAERDGPHGRRARIHHPKGAPVEPRQPPAP